MSVAAITCPSPTYPTSGTNPWCSTTAVRLLCVVLVFSWIILDQPALGLPNPSELTTVEGKTFKYFHPRSYARRV